MNITIFGATGMVGRQLIAHALAAGHAVKAFGRNVESLIDRDLKSDLFTAVKGYVFDSNDVKDALKGSDAVLSALGGGIEANDRTRSLGIKNITEQMTGLGIKRMIAVTGIGVLPSPEGGYFVHHPTYDKEYLAVGLEHVASYEILKNSSLDFTATCPPSILDEEADGKYAVAEDELPKSFMINAGNLALFMVKELSNNQFIGKRVSIWNE